MNLQQEKVVSPEVERHDSVAHQLGQRIVAARTEIAKGVEARSEAFRAIAERTGAAKTAMAEKFGVSEKDFWTVFTDNGETRQLTLVYAAPNGLLKGSWYDIFNPDSADDYTVTLSNEVQDARVGMTMGVYEGMVLELEVGRLIDATGNEIKSDTWLTGEPICGSSEYGEFAPLASNDHGNKPYLISGYAFSDRENVGEIRTFRPSFVVYSEPIIPSA